VCRGADTGPLREAPIPPVGRWILRKESLKEVVGKVVYAHVPVIDQDDDEEAMYAASPVKKLSASPSLGHRCGLQKVPNIFLLLPKMLTELET
jgi:hypothetical protein